MNALLNQTGFYIDALGQSVYGAYIYRTTGDRKRATYFLDKKRMVKTRNAAARSRLKYALTTGASRYKRVKVQPGVTRQSGYYGRYNNISSRANEVKFFDTALNLAMPLTASIGAQLNLIPQGTTQSTRIGRTAVIHSIQFRGVMIHDPGAANTSNTAYMYIVQDTQCNGAAAGITDVLTSNAISTAMINLSNSKRFRILKRFVSPAHFGAADSGDANAIIPREYPIDYFKKCNIPIEFSSTTGAITEIASNNVFVCRGGTSNNTGTFVGTCRIRFSD